MKVSVVIPTKNRADSLGQLLKALARQSHPILEVLVVDVSEDTSYQKGIMPNFPWPLYWLTSEAGVCIQRNVGIQKAKGSHIWLCDDDIEPPADYLETLVRYTQAHPVVGAVTGQWLQKESDGEWHSTYPPPTLVGLTLSYVFGLSVWGDPTKTPTSALLRGWHRYLVRRYSEKGNQLTRAGWPLVTQTERNIYITKVVSLGAALVRTDWLQKYPFDEVLDPHGLGDNYGVAIQFEEPIHVISNLLVKHHKSSENRLQATQAFYRRTLALAHFQRGAPFMNRLAYAWSLVGHGIRMLLGRNKLGLLAVRRLMWCWLTRQNPYTLGVRKGKKGIIPPLP